MDRRRALALLVVVAGVATVATPALAQGDFEERNERPLPEAGLDQDGIINGSRVYLDALGTNDPDGNVTRLEWTIRNVATNETVVPECPNCTTTHFTAPEPGRYAATITATDDDGATASDTMYVEVIPAAGPDVDVLAPNTTLRNASTPIQVRASATNATLTRMRITVDWRVIEARAVDTTEFAINVSHRFNVSGNVTVRASVHDSRGRLGKDRQEVRVLNGSADEWVDNYECERGIYIRIGDNDTCRVYAVDSVNGTLLTTGAFYDTVRYKAENGSIYVEEKSDIYEDGHGGGLIDKRLVVNTDNKHFRVEVSNRLSPRTNGSESFLTKVPSREDIWENYTVDLRGNDGPTHSAEDTDSKRAIPDSVGNSRTNTRQRRPTGGQDQCFAPCGASSNR